MGNTTPQHTSATVLREINLGAHSLFVMSDQSIDLMTDENMPYVADNALSLDSCEGSRQTPRATEARPGEAAAQGEVA